MDYVLNGFKDVSQNELEWINGGELFQSAEEANYAAFGFAVCAALIGGPLGTAYWVMAAYAYLEGATGQFGEKSAESGRSYSSGSRGF